jgi:hypothetical protein
MVNGMFEGVKCEACPFGENHSYWESKERPPHCVKSNDVYGLFSSSIEDGEWLPGILRFSKKKNPAFKKFKDLTGLAAQAFLPPSKRKPLFFSAYNFSSYETTDGTYMYHSIKEQILKSPLTKEQLASVAPLIEVFIKTLADQKFEAKVDDELEPAPVVSETVSDGSPQGFDPEDPFA